MCINRKDQKIILNPVPLKFECFSPFVKKELSCTVISEHSTQLVPPAKIGSTTVEKKISAAIEKVCDKVIIICGLVTKKITYTAVQNHVEVAGHSIIDEIPFQCIIESDDIKKGDKFKIVEKKLLCDINRELNFKKDHAGELSLVYRFAEKDIIKICVKKTKKD
ncbi:hypothetical protein BKP37_14515 [Anaerobacillus alkalilacustris]|uniref:SipL SPOCS domain-containing protein n=1 Tax=Anaerobacillus alkalilacustris TaxID=393763 RepID=A0A1S2LIN3_9BACI|nr:hypothetical protein [Anaerobacillus alkalilacustris]OIJ12090.1 hypothetical protein BKP37_14515 [Anaerobacillus alkalilacustris]